MILRRLGALLALTALLLWAPHAEAGRRRPPNPAHEPAGHLTWASPQSNPIALSPDASTVLVASTTSGLVDWILTASADTVPFAQIEVGLEPVAVAFRPDGHEAWVANHLSDSISVIDTNLASVSAFQVIETIQAFDGAGATDFDEPVGIAFKEDGSEAYVALSSSDRIAVIDTATYAVTGHVDIHAQDPRALAVRGNLLFVAAFESGNRSQLSSCEELTDDTHCTLVADDFGDFAANPNLPNDTKNIILDDDADYPDRDVFVFDITNGLADGAAPADVVSGVGTLLYGIVPGHSNGQLYVTLTDARNAENGIEGDNLDSLENRMFLNRITEIGCGGGLPDACGAVTIHELEAPPGSPVATPHATPYGVAISDDDAILIFTAAGSSRISTWDTAGGIVLDDLDVGAIPRGVAFDGGAGRAYVLDTLGNSVDVVDVDLGTGAMTPVRTISVGQDPTPDDVRLGRIAFNDAGASSSGTFSCASCHPDGNTDQLLWRIGGDCVGCDPGEDEVRSTMPVRGLRDTLPLHWDGTLADPYGGPNGSTTLGTNLPPSQAQEPGTPVCSLSNQEACFLHLVEASLSGVMCEQPSCPQGPSGQQGPLDDTERTNMAKFLERVSYPPARLRTVDDVLTSAAVDGFEDFWRDNPENRGNTGVDDLFVPDPETCADSTAGCHELPLGTASNSATLAAFDAPTMRGMTDRFLQFSLGLTNSQDLLAGVNDGTAIFIQGIPFQISTIPQPFGTWTPALGFEETFTFGVAYGLFDIVYGGNAQTQFQMFEEASTGHSGALGRQVTLNSATTAGCPACGVEALLDDLEAADAAGLVNLRGAGARYGPRSVSYDADADLYRFLPGAATRTRAQLIGEAQTGVSLVTLTARLRDGVSEDTPQPLVSVPGANCDSPGASVIHATTASDPALPILSPGSTLMDLEGAHVSASDEVYVDGALVPGATITMLGGPVECGAGSVTPDRLRIDLTNGGLPGGPEDTHLLQVHRDGLLSNELPFVVQ